MKSFFSSFTYVFFCNLCFGRLTGISPFLGETDEETLANVAAGDWDFEDSTWKSVSQTAKDFITKLMCVDKKYEPHSHKTFSCGISIKLVHISETE